jgi:hypothetical protein
MVHAAGPAIERKPGPGCMSAKALSKCFSQAGSRASGPPGAGPASTAPGSHGDDSAEASAPRHVHLPRPGAQVSVSRSAEQVGGHGHGESSQRQEDRTDAHLVELEVARVLHLHDVSTLSIYSRLSSFRDELLGIS